MIRSFYNFLTKEKDKDIVDILRFWYGEKIGPFRNEWFDRSIDQILVNKYAIYINKLLNCELENWKTSKYGRLAYLLVADQFSRNISRHKPIDQKRCDNMAVRLSIQMLFDNQDLEYSTMAERMFVLLPLRHTKNNQYIRKVLTRIEQYKTDCFYCTSWIERSPIPITMEHCMDVLEKFKTATIKNLDDLDSENKIYTPQQVHLITSEYDDILDREYVKREQMVEDSEVLLKNVDKYLENKKFKKLGVSLSGGIDSMVVLDLLVRLLGNENVVAIHVAHSNRDIAKRELEFLQKWCCLYRVDLVVRDVDYMNRENVDRNFYEDESKKIRFSLYRYCVQKYDLDGVCLGHHRDDIGENVMMNILTSRDAIDLKGMEKEKVMFGVNIIRPLLDVKKKLVWSYGRDQVVSCFKDSTPDWSWRGVLRRQIYPRLNERVGDIHDILAKLGDKSEEWNMIIEKLIYEPIFSSIKYYNYGCIFTLKENQLEMPNSFYTRILLEVFYKMKSRMITEKNQRGFVEWLKDKNTDKKYQLSNGYRAMKTSNGEICFAQDKLYDKKCWSYDIIEGATVEKREEFSIERFLEGRFVFTEEYTDVQKVQLVEQFEKGDHNRKLYNGFHWLPKLTSGKTICSENRALVIIYIQ